VKGKVFSFGLRPVYCCWVKITQNSTPAFSPPSMHVHNESIEEAVDEAAAAASGGGNGGAAASCGAFC